eukprot:163261_1
MLPAQSIMATIKKSTFPGLLTRMLRIKSICLILSTVIFINIIYSCMQKPLDLFGIYKHSSAAQTVTSNVPDTHEFRILFFTISNNGFFNLVQNWILNLEHNNIVDYRVYCTDINCVKSMVKFNKKQHVSDILLPDSNVTYASNTSPTFAWGSRSFDAFTANRPSQISAIYHSVMNEGIYDAVLYQDADLIVVNPNITHVIQSNYLYYDQNHTILNDIVVSRDCKGFMCNQWSSLYCSCLIFIPFSSHKVLNVFLHRWHQKCEKKGAQDQNAMTFVIKTWGKSDETYEIKLHLGLFDKFQFPSGAMVGHEKYLLYLNSDSNVKNNRMTLHANFHVGNEDKINFFKQHNKWLV